MKDKLVKGRKRRLKWNDFIFAFQEPYLEVAFYKYYSEHKNISRNRVAYNFLKTHYSTTLMRKVKISYEKYLLEYDEIIPFLRWESAAYELF